MSETIFVFHRALDTITADTVASGDLIMVYDTSATKVVKARVQDILSASGGGSSTLTATTTGTISFQRGVITTAAQTVSATGYYTMTITNSFVTAGDIVLFSVANGTNTQGLALIHVSAGAGNMQFLINGSQTTLPLSGTLKVSFVVFKA